MSFFSKTDCPSFYPDAWQITTKYADKRPIFAVSGMSGIVNIFQMIGGFFEIILIIDTTSPTFQIDEILSIGTFPNEER